MLLHVDFIIKQPYIVFRIILDAFPAKKRLQPLSACQHTQNLGLQHSTKFKLLILIITCYIIHLMSKNKSHESEQSCTKL